VVPYLVGVPKRNGKLSTETFCLTDRVQHGHAHRAHQTCTAESSLGTLTTERAESLCHAAGAQRPGCSADQAA
jgi:hypothetical protein